MSRAAATDDSSPRPGSDRHSGHRTRRSNIRSSRRTRQAATGSVSSDGPELLHSLRGYSPQRRSTKHATREVSRSCMAVARRRVGGWGIDSRSLRIEVHTGVPSMPAARSPAIIGPLTDRWRALGGTIIDSEPAPRAQTPLRCCRSGRKQVVFETEKARSTVQNDWR